jgi:hypothetical protein
MILLCVQKQIRALVSCWKWLVAPNKLCGHGSVATWNHGWSSRDAEARWVLEESDNLSVFNAVIEDSHQET